jgi:hypothetical protein
MSVPPDALALYAAVILLLPMACFFLSSPVFLLVGLEIPEVTRLLRGMFDGYFLVVGITGVVATILFAVAGRPVFAVGATILASVAIAVRRWLLRRMDAGLLARDAGAPFAVRQLRVVHLNGMLINAVQLAAVVASVAFIV